MATSDSQLRATRKYQKKNTTQLLVRLNLRTDDDIIRWLEHQPSKMGYIKALIRQDIARANPEE